MTCEHRISIDVKRYKNQTIYCVVCMKCGLRTVWVESPELAKELFQANDDMLLVKKGVIK